MPNTAPAPLPLALWRALRVPVHILWGALLIGLLFPWLSMPRRLKMVGWWSRALVRLLGIHIDVEAPAPTAPFLLVANHISWLDIFIINSWQPCRFVAKSEVNHWPVIGFLCRHSGTLFISRQKRHDTGRIRQQMGHALAKGHPLGIFPEGTTTEGDRVLPFNPSLLQAALDTGSPVQALRLVYRNADGSLARQAAYAGDTSMAESIWALARSRGLSARLTLLPVIPHWDGDRRSLADHCQRLIAAEGFPEASTSSEIALTTAIEALA